RQLVAVARREDSLPDRVDRRSRIRLVGITNAIATAAVVLLAVEPGGRAAVFTNVGTIFGGKAVQHPMRLLKFNLGRATPIVISRRLEREAFSPSERASLAEALRFARLSNATSPDNQTAFTIARLLALSGDEADALDELRRRPVSAESRTSE